MASIIDALQKEIVKNVKIGKKLGEMLADKLDKDLPGRVFNDFPPLLPEKELNELISEYIAILIHAQIELNEKGELQLKPTDKETLPAIYAWYAKVVQIGCESFLDLSGYPSESFLQFLELDETHRKKLEGKVDSMLSSFTEHIAGLAVDKFTKLENFHDYLNAYAFITTNASKATPEIYFKQKHEQYIELIKSVFNITVEYKTHLVEQKKKLETKISTEASQTEKTKLEQQVHAIDKTIRSINRFACGTVSPSEFLAELKEAQKLFKQQKSFAFIKWEKSDSQNDSFIQKLEALTKDFLSERKVESKSLAV